MEQEELIKKIEELFEDKKYIPIKHGKGDKEFWNGVAIARQVYRRRVIKILKDGTHKSSKEKSK